MLEAHRLGYQLAFKVERGLAFARLVPTTSRTRALCRAHRARAIEANMPITAADERLDAMREAARAALAHAKDANVR